MKNNPFANVNKNKEKNKVKLQTTLQNDIIAKKKAGRPKKPDMQVFGVRFPKSLRLKVQAYCERENESLSAFFQRITKEYFKHND